MVVDLVVPRLSYALLAGDIASVSGTGNADPNNPKIKCSLDLTDCEESFQTQIKDAGTDIKAQCLSGATFENCLSRIETNSDCSSSKATVETLKGIYKQQIDQAMCSSQKAENCAIGVKTCSNTYHTQFNAQTKDDGRCKVANTYIKCLNGVSCSKSFEQQLTTAVLMVQMDLQNNTATCDLVKFNAGGGASSSFTVSTATFVMSLFMVLYARLLQ
ncbi:hypothetical protein ElyMa_001580300 [Elysia marginata]|uniref:Secreted protein n=1 Tax=Elysia marginata TaxID=1093978 RepID=A0AAV4JDF1_9GAST|nr:hypothetical protein ElyMa_001580300 [Elysia marginata]